MALWANEMSLTRGSEPERSRMPIASQLAAVRRLPDQCARSSERKEVTVGMSKAPYDEPEPQEAD